MILIRYIFPSIQLLWPTDWTIAVVDRLAICTQPLLQPIESFLIMNDTFELIIVVEKRVNILFLCVYRITSDFYILFNCWCCRRRRRRRLILLEYMVVSPPFQILFQILYMHHE